MELFCKLSDLENESDVEQKLMFPMLTAVEPMGFGYLISDFKTKSNIRRFEIDKGQSAKLYYPDYIVVTFPPKTVPIAIRVPA